MRVSAKSDYALRALIELACVSATKVSLSADAIGSSQDIPRGFLLSILADLRRAGLVRSQRGQAGGWRLAKPASEMTVADVIRAVDGPLVSLYDQRPEAVVYNENAAPLQQVWISARHALRSVLESVSIQQLADRNLPKEVTMRTKDEDAWRSH